MCDNSKKKFNRDLEFHNKTGSLLNDNSEEQHSAPHELSLINVQEDTKNPHGCLESSIDLEQEQEIFENWFQNIKSIEDINFVTNQCEHISKALEFLKNIECSDNLHKVTAVKLCIEDDVISISQYELSMLAEKFHKKAVILIILRKIDDSPLMFWKSDAIGYFLTLNDFSNTTSNDERKVYEFVGDFLIKSLKVSHLGIFNFIAIHHETKIIELNFLADSRDYNLLLLAAETGNVQVSEYLLKMGINTNSPHKDINAQSLAYENGNFGVLLLFLKYNLNYPSSIDINNCSNDIKKFHLIAKDLHDAIKSNDDDKIVEIIAENPQQRHFYNFKNHSAPTIALINKQTDIYKLLINHNVHFGPHENTDGIMENFEYDERRDLREFHNQHAQDLPEKHLNALMTSSVVSHDVTDVNRKPDLVMGAFKLLNEILLIRTILKVVAASRKLQMIFDFNRESVEVADPTVDSKTFGLFYLTGRIYIGALHLLNKATQCETLGTMAHELCHYAMHLTFGNDANPYRKDDKEAKDEFERINQICKKNREENGFIKVVYDEYPEEAHHAELIVRVPHILAFYSDEPEEVEKCQKTFKPLFDFYEHKVVPEMEKALPDIEQQLDREIEKKDKKISDLVKVIIILIISSLVVVGLLVLILHKPDIKFQELSSKNQKIIKNSVVKYKNVNVKLSDLFADNSTVYEKFSSDHLRTMLDKDILDLNDPLLKFTDDLITHNWKTLSDPLKQKFLNSNFTFQNQSLKLNYFYDLNSKAFDELSSNQIYKVLNESDLFIGKISKPSVDNYINRKFSHQNSKKTKNITDIIDETEKSKLLILSAVAGAGKTTTFEYLTVKIKEQFPNRWVSYVDLKKHTNLYDNSNPPQAFDLLSKILNLDQKSEFEKKVFQESFESGRSVVLWNGFDEISPTYSKFIVNIIKAIKRNTKNVQYISTRPSYAKDLQSDLNEVPHVLIPLKKNEQQRFLNNYFHSQSKNVTIINQNIEKVQKILKDIDAEDSRDFNTPLMLKMVAEIQDDPRLLDSTNLYQIYELFVDKKNKIWFDKGELAKSATTNLFKFSLYQTYQKFALLQEKSIFNDGSVFLKLMNLQILRTIYSEKLPFTEITQLGILQIENEKKFQFWHRTFAEFFVAQYIIENIYLLNEEISSREVELRLILFYKIVPNYDSNFIINLMHSYIKSKNKNDSSFSESIIELLRTKFKDFIFFATNKSLDSFKFLLDFFNKDHVILTELLQINEKETLYTKKINAHDYIFSEKVKEICREYLTRDEFDKFTTGADQNGKIRMWKKYEELTSAIPYMVLQTIAVDYSDFDEYKDGSAEFVDDNDDDEDEYEESSGNYSGDDEDYEGSYSGDDEDYEGSSDGSGEDFDENSGIGDDSFDFTTYKPYTTKDEEINLFYLFIDELKQNLTKPEIKELLLALTNPKIFGYDRIFSKYLSLKEFENVWNEIEFLNLTIIESDNLFSNAIIEASECFIYGLPYQYNYIGCENILNTVTKVMKKLMTNVEIYELFFNENILHKVVKLGGQMSFSPIWDFFMSVTNEEQQEKIYEKFDNGDDVFSPRGSPPFTLVHLRLLNELGDVRWFFNERSKADMQNVLIQVPYFLLYFIENSKFVTCFEFAKSLNETFKNDENELENILKQKIKPRNWSIFEYFDGIGSNRSPCLKYFSSLLMKKETKIKFYY